MFWGLTPSLDLLDIYLKESKTLPPRLNILLVGGADSRHVLQTVARRYRHDALSTELNFFVCEASVETVAKQLLLLNVATQHPSVMGPVSKAKIFMELYGNTLVRPSVSKFLVGTSKELIKMVTDLEYLKTAMPFIEIELKYKERDYFESLLKFWSGKDEFNICDSWDRRLRKNLGVRYDSKLGAFDWDLHMRLHCIGAKQICNQEYRNFRLNGVAFGWLESEVSKPNRSMVCVVAPNGENFIHYGYLGDMTTGPFISYGLNCDDKEFLRDVNGQNLYRATDVTERNLLQIFHEMQFGEPYTHASTSDNKLGPVVMNIGDRVIDIKSSEVSICKNKCFALPHVRIKFISLSLFQRMTHRQDFCKFFDLVYFGCFYVKYLCKETLQHVMKPGGVCLVENQKFVVSHREQQLKEFAEEVKKAMGGFFKEKKFDPGQDNYAFFVNNKQ